jgi:hypothetical protein
MSSLEGISGQTSPTSKWLDFFGSWMGLLLVSGILLFGITGRMQFSCNPMVTLGDLPSFCDSAEIIRNASSRPTHGSALIPLAGDKNQDSNKLRDIYKIKAHLVEDNRQFRNYVLATNTNTPEDVFLRLARSDDLEVLNGLLSNKSVVGNSKVMKRLCSNSLIKEKQSCYSPPPPSCRKNHARNLMIGAGLGVLGFVAAPILLPAGALIAPVALGSLGGASTFLASTSLLELFTKC